MQKQVMNDDIKPRDSGRVREECNVNEVVTDHDGLVSIVIPTFNSALRLEECLRSVAEQTYNHLETIVIDNLSSDQSCDLARKFHCKIVITPSGLSAARNIGLIASHGSYVIMLDSDMRMDSRVIEECVNEAEKGADAVIIPEDTLGSGFWVRCRRLERQLYRGNALVESPRFFRKSALLLVNGYNSDPRFYFGEDMDLAIRLRVRKMKIGRVAASIGHQEGELRLGRHLRKRFASAQTSVLFLSRHGIASIRYYGIRRYFHPGFRSLFHAERRVIIGLVFLKSLEYLVAIAGLMKGASKRIFRRNPGSDLARYYEEI